MPGIPSKDASFVRETPRDYALTGYLNNLYARWHKPEKALEYKEKWLNARNEQNKNITHRNA